MAGIYIHIPFCRSRCAYCDFFSTTRENEAETYVKALCCELEARRHELPRAHVSTIYIGGGTPSVLAPTLLRQILDGVYANYDVASDTEVTMEMNPDDVNQFTIHNSQFTIHNSQFTIHNSQLAARSQFFILHSSFFINRVSLGIQTFDDNLLRLIHRRHDSASAVQAVRSLQEAGISNISIDLIYGLPGQTMEQWEHDLDTAFSLPIQHLSAYALSYEEGTLLTRWRNEGRISEVSDELSVAMYQRLCERAREAGFEHYEISNFALPGFHSRHNSSYWTGIPYLGFGPGAHSYDGLCTRRANLSSLDAYIENPTGSFTIENLSSTDLQNEAVMCGLRTSRGIDLQHFHSRFGEESLHRLLAAAAPHLRAGRLKLETLPEDLPTHLHLTENSIMVSDDIMSDMMECITF